MNNLLLQNEFIQGCLVLIASIAAAQLAPLPKHWLPWLWFRLLANQLAAKVNHLNRSVSQQMTAGILATLLLVIPITTITAFFLELAAYGWFFDFLILYCSISDYQFTHQAKRIQAALEKGNNASAKVILAPWVSQSTQRLSSVGLCKTTIEKTLIAPVYGSVATVLFFALGGSTMVIAAHLLKQLEQCWPTYHPNFVNFSSFIGQFNRLLFFIPRLLWQFSLAIQFGQLGVKSIVVTDKVTQGLNNDFSVIHLGANLLKTELGGPQQFILPSASQKLSYTNGAAETVFEKVALAKVLAGPLPHYQHIHIAIKAAQNGKFFFLALAILLPLLWALLQNM
ncbi:cobalamin biosynthesis protein [Shewanella sp. OMA3-2]|uniref:cobalamin biosynthesis protein n=1 Tax=Shewanella sp. OMA3-2 TaxID=2908650 RepID=UPI001F32BFF2|nr:cobalamin biosynthesis protein [Shewanella sp. OMA3-2]UJF21473.1 cobalamin biosynthesis protein [Shewanella sp. OMA3-2]